jgi:NAD kinase
VRPKTIGLIVNPKSGQGAEYNLALARRLVQALAPEMIYTGQGQLDDTILADIHELSVTGQMGRSLSQALALMIVQRGVDALVVIGGDGTMADVAFALYQSAAQCPILGIGAGSINAGDLVTCKANLVGELASADFEIKSISALVAGCNGDDLALAFNDVVIGTTIVGTLLGNICDLDANAFMRGEQIKGIPQPIAGEMASVVKINATKQIIVSTGKSVGTVVAGFAQNPCFFGKAIVGAVGLTSLAGIEAGCLVCEQALVCTQPDRQKHVDSEPIRSSYVSLAAEDRIEVSGLTYPAVLCADGNPLKALQLDDICHIRVQPNAVSVLRIAQSN